MNHKHKSVKSEGIDKLNKMNKNVKSERIFKLNNMKKIVKSKKKNNDFDKVIT